MNLRGITNNRKAVVALIVLIAVVAVFAYQANRNQRLEAAAAHQTYIDQTILEIDKAQQAAEQLLSNWQQSSVQDVSKSLDAISNHLLLTQNQFDQLKAHYQDQSGDDEQISTAFLSDLFELYARNVDSMKNQQSLATEKNALLQTKLASLNLDLKMLSQKIDRNVFYTGSLEQVRTHWQALTASLQYEEVTNVYRARYQ